MGSKVTATFFIFMILSLVGLPLTTSCGYCPPYHRPNPPTKTYPPPKTIHPPQQGGGKGGPPKVSPPKTKPPILLPPVVNPPPVVTPPGSGGIIPPIINPPGSGIIPPITNPPGSGGLIPPILNPPGSGGIIPPILNPPGSSTSPPYSGSPPSGGGTSTPTTCPINALKLGLCVDVLSGLVHIGLGNPVENACCPILQGLLELEAAICLCTTIRLKLLNLNIFIPIALQVIATCGLSPPPGFVCPPLT